jgi:hypothetical protein
VRLVLLLLLLIGCKERGTLSLDLDVPATCEPWDRVQVYLVRAATCDCVCDECLAACDAADTCTLGCPPEGCPASALDDGLAVAPPASGFYAVVYQFLSAGDGLRVHATACQEVEVMADGTASMTYQVAAHCCPE